ncbi:TPA: Bax inhibitor-1/YccA family protein, partial [Bacillus cereus]|nr:Bax inhibitor-1/YccA family protein [Bacillus cereus]
DLLLDFDLIENGARSGAAKYMEWYSAIGLMMTLVWLYLEILRFVSYFMKNKE